MKIVEGERKSDMLKKALKNERGLTLVELLAVIVILGIIAAIAVPSVSTLINKSNNKAKVAEAVEIIDAAKLYVADNNVQVQNGSNLNLSWGYLDPYLDHVKDKNFTVSVVTDGNGKVTYYIYNHEANSIVGNPASESQLTDWLNSHK
jgi:type IV pilus assembly protein PilA